MDRPNVHEYEIQEYEIVSDYFAALFRLASRNERPKQWSSRQLAMMMRRPVSEFICYIRATNCTFIWHCCPCGLEDNSSNYVY